MNDTVIYLLTHLNHKKKSFATFFFHWILYTYIYNTCTQLYINILINSFSMLQNLHQKCTFQHVHTYHDFYLGQAFLLQPENRPPIGCFRPPFYQSRIKAVGVQSREPDNTPLTGFYILQAHSSWQWVTSLKTSEHQNRHLRTVLFIATRS